MIIQITQLNELMQKKVMNELKERNLSLSDVNISVNGAKITITILATKETIIY